MSVVAFMRGANIPHNLAGLVNGRLTRRRQYTPDLHTLMVHTRRCMACRETMCSRRLGTRSLSSRVSTVDFL